MDDLISRQAAINSIDDLPNCPNGFSDCYDKARIISVLEELPTIEPKKGRWEKHYLPDCTYYTCSVCGFESIDSVSVYDDDGWYVEEVPTNYCPNCGAKMGQ